MALKEIEEVEGAWREILKEEGGFVIGGEGREVAVGSAFPMRVIAEIVNAPTLDLDHIRKRARYFEAEGADIIDIGMLANDPKPERIGEILNAVRSSVELPVSIDTLDPSEIEAWEAREPVSLYHQRLTESGILCETELSAIESAIDAEIEDAFNFARVSPLPLDEELTEYVYTR